MQEVVSDEEGEGRKAAQKGQRKKGQQQNHGQKRKQGSR
jgi:hypothetical protein